MNEVNNSMNPLNQNPNQFSGNDTNNLNNNMGYNNNNMMNNQSHVNNNSMNFENGNIPNNYSNYNNQPNNILNNGMQVNSYSTNTYSQSNLENQSSNMYSQPQNNDINYMNNNIQNNYSMQDTTVNTMNDVTLNQAPMTSRMDKYNTSNLDNQTNDMNANIMNNIEANNNMMDNNSVNDMNNDIPISSSSLPNNNPVNNNQNITPMNNKNKQKDDTEAYFADAKKKGFPIWIIFVILFLVVIGGGVYYFFVIDTPQNIFSGLLNSKIFEIKLEDYEKTTIDFEGNAKMMSSDEDMKQVFDIVNKLSIKGSIGEDYKNKTFFLNLEPMYESKELLKMNAYYENSNLYLESKDIYDKVLKSELPEETVDMINELFENENKEDVEIIISSIKKGISNALENVQNKKEYVKLDKNYVKKVSIIIKPQTLADVYKSLANDSEFLSSLSKITGETQSDIKESLEEEIEYNEDYEEGNYEPIKISLYVSILTNKFYKAEIIGEEVMITVEQEDDVFSYKLYDEDDIIQVEGSFSLVKNNKTDYSLFYSIDVIEEQVSMEFNIDYSVKYNEDIQKVPTTGAIDINDLSDEDTNKIITNISENENLKKFIEDISAIFSYGVTGDEDYLA